MVVNVKLNEDTKLYYDEDRKVLYVDEIPHRFYNRDIFYPIWNETINSKGVFRTEVIVPHNHILPNGSTIKMENVKFPVLFLPYIKEIELVKFEDDGKVYHWISLKSNTGYEYMLTSSKGIDVCENLEWDTELPEYLKNINIWK